MHESMNRRAEKRRPFRDAEVQLRYGACPVMTMVGSGIPPDAIIAEGFRLMTLTEMEDAINKLDRRLSLVEQILPTLATKQDLHEAFKEAKRHIGVLFEAVRDDI